MHAFEDNKSGPLYIGLMSGTSLDGIDAVLVDFSDKAPVLLGSYLQPFSAELRNALLDLTQPGDNEIDRMGAADIQFAQLQAAAVKQLLTQTGHSPGAISAIGSHGQTIRHRPQGDIPFTLQIGDPNTLTELTGITVAADFRRRDMAAGGQGAPLVPAFHDAYLRHTTINRIVLNIGGIANITLLEHDKPDHILGYDTGPGNVLMDAWSTRHLGRSYDTEGHWARTGEVNVALLNHLLNCDYLKQPAPKSTGRELFHVGWLDEQLQTLTDHKSIPTEDTQATLLEFTAQSISRAILSHQLTSLELYACGGGAQNQALLERLQQLLHPVPVLTTEQLGLPGDWLEAIAFAWLAKACIEGTCGNQPSVTGATGKRILGGVYQA